MKIRQSIDSSSLKATGLLKKVYTIDDADKILLYCRFDTMPKLYGNGVQSTCKDIIVPDMMILSQCGGVYGGFKTIYIRLPHHIEKDFKIDKWCANKLSDDEKKVLTKYASFINTMIKEDIEELVFYMGLI